MGTPTEWETSAAGASERESGVVSLHRQVRGIVAAVVVLSRLATLAMVAISIVGAVQVHAYARVALATTVYAILFAWSAVLITLVLRRAAVSGKVMVVDVTVTVATMVMLPLTVDNTAFSLVSNSYLEPIMVSVAVSVALVSGSARGTVASCTALAIAYVIGQAPLAKTGADDASLVSTIGW
jgi:hypothetical protein